MSCGDISENEICAKSCANNAECHKLFQVKADQLPDMADKASRIKYIYKLIVL